MKKIELGFLFFSCFTFFIQMINVLGARRKKPTAHIERTPSNKLGCVHVKLIENVYMCHNINLQPHAHKVLCAHACLLYAV